MPKPALRRPLLQHWKTSQLWGRNTPHLAAKDWLLNTQSLTVKIRQTCPQMRVEILFEGQALPWPSEARSLGCRAGETVWTRCVLLVCETQPLIYARTLIPNMHSGNPWHALKHLGNRPLGEVLFKDNHIQRTPFFWLKFNQAWLNLSQKTPQKPHYWARQSQFKQAKAPLLLTEVFLNLET